MAYRSVECSIPKEVPFLEVFDSDFPVSLLDNWKLMSRKEAHRSLGYVWTGITSCEKTDGSWVDFKHKGERMALYTPVCKNRPAQVWTGRRVTQVLPSGPSSPPLPPFLPMDPSCTLFPQAKPSSPKADAIPQPQWGRHHCAQAETTSHDAAGSDGWVSPDELPENVLAAVAQSGREVAFVWKHAANRRTRYFPESGNPESPVPEGPVPGQSISSDRRGE